MEIVIRAAQGIFLAIHVAGQSRELWIQGWHFQALELRALALTMHPPLAGVEWSHLDFPMAAVAS